MIKYGIDNFNQEKAIEIAQSCGISFDTARILLRKNIDSVEKVNRFFNPSKKYFNSPSFFKNMSAIVDRIKSARDNKESVLIFGDYDADGICACTVLYNCLRIFGITARYTVPERADGYGLNLGIIDRLNSEEKIDLIITVDCGISDHDKIETIKAKGIDVIVTDHHEQPEVLPECLYINPKVKDSGYPFPYLCGAGVAYKLGNALIGNIADSYLDFVSIATLADSMELIEENRDIVYEGLKIFNSARSKTQYQYLYDSNKAVDTHVISFQISPRLNAAGRMGDSMTCLKMFISDDEREIRDYSIKINEYNIARQSECDKVYKEVKERIKNDKKTGLICVFDEKWQIGFLGIVASKICEEYSRPTVIFGGINGELKGSARSVEGFNIFEAISSCKDILTTFGGHAQAAGVGIKTQDFDEFYSRLDKFISENCSVSEEKTYNVEWKIDSVFPLEFSKELELLEPYGVGNKKPLFALDFSYAVPRVLKPLSPHYSFDTDYIQLIRFYSLKDMKLIEYPIKKTVVFESSFSRFNGIESNKGIVKAIEPDKRDQNYYLYELENTLDTYISDNSIDIYDISKKYSDRINTDRNNYSVIYKTILKYSGNSCNSAYNIYNKESKQFDAIDFIFAFYVFIELGFFSFADGKLVKNETVRKDLSSSSIFRTICELRG